MKDLAIQEFSDFVDNMKNPIVKLYEEQSSNLFHTINLKTLTKDIRNHTNFREWWEGKNLTKHLNNVLIKTLLGLEGLPKSVEHALYIMML